MQNMRTPKLPATAAGLAAVALLGTACRVLDVHPTAALDAHARWAQLPMVNYAEAPQAGQRAEAILATLLREHGIVRMDHYPAQGDPAGLPDLNDARRLDKAMEWAKGEGYQYGVSGAVSEWQYKTGLDGEPAVGLSVQVVDLADGQVVWTASGADSGWGYDSASAVAQTLLNKLVAGLPLK
jgi:hypothetical protein